MMVNPIITALTVYLDSSLSPSTPLSSSSSSSSSSTYTAFSQSELESMLAKNSAVDADVAFEVFTDGSEKNLAWTTHKTISVAHSLSLTKVVESTARDMQFINRDIQTHLEPLAGPSMTSPIPSSSTPLVYSPTLTMKIKWIPPEPASPALPCHALGSAYNSRKKEDIPPERPITPACLATPDKSRRSPVTCPSPVPIPAKKFSVVSSSTKPSTSLPKPLHAALFFD